MSSTLGIASIRRSRPKRRLFQRAPQSETNKVVQAGQIIVLFALMLTALIGLVGIAIDVTWAWRKGVEIQRAADAGSLAGVVYLPGDLDTAKTRARAEVGRNGYGGAAIDVAKNPDDDHQLDVTVTADVPTFFVRIFHVDHWTISRKSRAGFVLPVPMGSPENFYGVYCNTKPGSTNCPEGTAITGADGTTVYSHGAWGAIQATGTDHGQGDAFIPYSDRSASLGTNPFGGSNPDYDGGGYNYGIELPAGGTIYIYDPTACAVGDGVGTGDHWNDSGGWQTPRKVYSVSTYYKVYNMTNDLLNYGNQPFVSGSGTLFEREYQYDQTGTYGTPGYRANLTATSADGKPLKDCGAGRITDKTIGGYWHNKWYPVASNLAAGTYRLNISSAALGSPNQNATFENDFSIEAVGAGSGSKNPRVYGLGRMVQYNIIQGAGKQSFYLAQIGPENAGKTMQIDLFDIGDINGTGDLRIISPNGNAWSYANFTYWSDANCGKLNGLSDSCTDSGGTTVITSKDAGGHQSWNDSWVHIFITLPSNYGCSVASPCLKPVGETQQGWWKIEYSTTSGANDTTTWMVSLRGNPVRLVPID